MEKENVASKTPGKLKVPNGVIGKKLLDIAGSVSIVQFNYL